MSRTSAITENRGAYPPDRHEEAEVVLARDRRVPADARPAIRSTRQQPHQANEQGEFPRGRTNAVCTAQRVVLCPDGIVLDPVKMSDMAANPHPAVPCRHSPLALVL